MHVVEGCEEFGHVLSMTCGVDSCVAGGVNCGSGSVLCAVLVVFLLQCWFLYVGAIGNGKMEAEAACSC